jgi:hypothetical protein
MPMHLAAISEILTHDSKVFNIMLDIEKSMTQHLNLCPPNPKFYTV